MTKYLKTTKRFSWLVLMFVGSFVYAQNTNLRAVSKKYAITGATIITTPGQKINNGTVLFENGIITKVGTNIKVPYDAIEIPAKDMFVYAGFISGASSMGVKNPKMEKPKDNKRLTGRPSYKRAGITPQENVRQRLNNKSGGLEGYRKLGFTASQIIPEGGMIAGKTAVILTSNQLPVIKENTSMYCQLKGAGGVYPNTVIGVMAKFRDLYKKANQNRRYSSTYASNNAGMQRPTDDAVLSALYPVTATKMPVLFGASNIKDALRVLTLQKELGFKLVLADLKQGWDIIPQLKAKNVPVFLSLNLPKKEKESKEKDKKDESEEKKALEKRKKEAIEKYYSQFAKFQKQGVVFGFSNISSKSKDFKKTIREIIKSGLSEDQALAALTVNPAKMLGVSSMMGEVKVGKMANLIISDKSYFDKKSKVKYVFVEGEEFKIESKNKKAKAGKKVDFSGNWKYTTDTGDGKSGGVIKLKKTKDAYSGTIYVGYTGSEEEIKSTEVEGNTLTFTFDLTIDGNAVGVTAKMEVEGNDFEGNFDAKGLGNFAMEGSREPKN